jgi:hypothetical protein
VSPPREARVRQRPAAVERQVAEPVLAPADGPAGRRHRAAPRPAAPQRPDMVAVPAGVAGADVAEPVPQQRVGVAQAVEGDERVEVVLRVEGPVPHQQAAPAPR